MSENPDVAEFEAARSAAMGDEGHDEPVYEADDGGSQVIEADGDGGDDEPKTKNWEKIAQDKEAALAAERTRRKNEAKRARELEDRLAKIEAQTKGADKDEWDEVLAALREDDEDPIGDIAAIKKLVRNIRAERSAEREQAQTQEQAKRQFNAFKATFEEAEADFADSHPDYVEAAAHYRNERRAELEALGHSGATLDAVLGRELIGVVQTAMQSGRDPAETVYNLAKRRGFASGTAQAEDKLKKLTDSARAGAKPTGGKPAGSGNLTAESVNRLSGAAFDAAFAKMRQSERRAR